MALIPQHFPESVGVSHLPTLSCIQCCPYLHLSTEEGSSGPGCHGTLRWKLTVSACCRVFTVYQKKCRNKQCKGFNHSAQSRLSNTQSVNYIHHSQHGPSAVPRPCPVSSPSGKPSPLAPDSLSRAFTGKCGHNDTGLPPELRVDCVGKQGTGVGQFGWKGDVMKTAREEKRALVGGAHLEQGSHVVALQGWLPCRLFRETLTDLAAQSPHASGQLSWSWSL